MNPVLYIVEVNPLSSSYDQYRHARLEDAVDGFFRVCKEIVDKQTFPNQTVRLRRISMFPENEKKWEQVIEYTIAECSLSSLNSNLRLGLINTEEENTLIYSGLKKIRRAINAIFHKHDQEIFIGTELSKLIENSIGTELSKLIENSKEQEAKEGNIEKQLTVDDLIAQQRYPIVRGYIMILEAWAEGKIIQQKFIDGGDLDWHDIDQENIVWDFSTTLFRVKP